MPDWKTRTLYDRIHDQWMSKESQYSRRNTNVETVIRCFRSDETPTKGSEQSTYDSENMEFFGKDIYNGSGAWYSRMMATGFQGSSVSKNIVWIKYMMEEFELKGVDQLDIWLQDMQDYMTNVYQRSNFYQVQPQFTLDGLTIGSPLMFGEEDILEKKTMWTPQYYRNVRMYYDRFNQCEGVIVRDPRWTAKQIYDEFIVTDDENGTKAKQKLTLAINKSLDAGALGDEYVVYRAVFKVNDKIWDDSNEDGFRKPAGSWKWLSVYFLELSDADQDKKNNPLNDNMGFFTQPFTYWDFDKKPWEASSRTPAWYAIWDCMGLQQVYKNFLENMQLKNRSPKVILDTMKGRVALSPEGEMYVTDAEYDRAPKSLDLIGDVMLNKEMSDIFEDALKRWFYIDRFQMFSDLTRTNKQPVTATQIWQMAGEKATLLSPAIETHSKHLEMADARMIDIEVHRGEGPFDPDVMANITDIIENTLGRTARSFGVRPVFVGPLAQAQKVSQAIEPITATMGAVSPLIEMFPELRHKYRPYEISGKIEDAFDFPQDGVKPKEEYDEIVDAERQAALANQQAQMAIEMAKAAPAVSGAVDETSILAETA